MMREKKTQHRRTNEKRTKHIYGKYNDQKTYTVHIIQRLKNTFKYYDNINTLQYYRSRIQTKIT